MLHNQPHLVHTAQKQCISAALKLSDIWMRSNVQGADLRKVCLAACRNTSNAAHSNACAEKCSVYMQMATLHKALALEERLQQASFDKAMEELESLKAYAKAQVQQPHKMPLHSCLSCVDCVTARLT